MGVSATWSLCTAFNLFETNASVEEGSQFRASHAKSSLSNLGISCSKISGKQVLENHLCVPDIQESYSLLDGVVNTELVGQVV